MSFRIWLYNLVSIILSPLLVIVVVIRHLIKKRPYQLLFAPTTKSKGSYYWIQTASAGETVLAKTLIDHLAGTLPDAHWLIVTSTYSGYCNAQHILGERAIILYFHYPIDFTFPLQRLIKRYPPLALIIVESDIRPNLVYHISRKNAKIMLVNGRVGKCYWWYNYFLVDSWKRIDFFSVKSPQDRNSFIKIGAPADRIKVNGNLKFDQEFPEIDAQQRHKLFEGLGLQDSCRLIVAGSTHPGEEEIILDAFQKILIDYPDVVLLIAPRHLRRVAEIEALLVSRGRKYWLRSNPRLLQEARIVILDTYGELATIYSLAELAIVGYSFIDGGGHNILEPIGYGCPVFFGPYMKHFQEIANRAIAAEVGFEVEDSNSLAAGCLRFLHDDRLRRLTAEKAKALMLENRGAANRNVELILATLGKQAIAEGEPRN